MSPPSPVHVVLPGPSGRDHSAFSDRCWCQPVGARDLATGGMAYVHYARDPSVTIRCRDYRVHASSHRQTPDGWTCDRCEPPTDS